MVAILSAMLATLLNAQISEAAKKKRDAFIKAREEMRTVASPTPARSPSGKPKAVKKRKKGESGKVVGERKEKEVFDEEKD